MQSRMIRVKPASWSVIVKKRSGLIQTLMAESNDRYVSAVHALQ